MNFEFAANELQKIYGELRQYEEFRGHATKILTIGSELRKLHRPSEYAGICPADFKPLPPKSDPNSKIPRPTTPPKGSGPVKLALAPGREVQI